MLRTLFFNPTEFFSAVKKESDYWPSMKLFAIIYLISNGMFFIPLAAIFPFIPGMQISGMWISILILFLGTIISLIYAFLTPWIYAFFTYLGVLVFGGKDKYFFPTFKASTYGLCIMMIYNLFINAIFLVFGIFALLIVMGSSNNNPPSPAIIFGFVSFLILLLLLALIGFIHRVYATMAGLVLYNNMTYGKSFLAVIFIPAIMVIVYIMFVIAVGLNGVY